MHHHFDLPRLRLDAELFPHEIVGMLAPMPEPFVGVHDSDTGRMRPDVCFPSLARLIPLFLFEMVTMQAVIHGKRERVLGFEPMEHPLALQVGGDQPDLLAQCARVAQDLGYDEINLNVGCPSDRVQSGNFGACLMKDSHRVAACVTAMREACTLPVTVKHRIGVDDIDRYEDMAAFVDVVAAAGCDRFTVHARKAWLSAIAWPAVARRAAILSSVTPSKGTS